MNKPSFLPVIAILIGTALGASSGLFIKGLSISSLALSGFRMGVPFLLLFPYVIRMKTFRGTPGMGKRLILGSSLNSIRMFFYIAAYKLTTLGNAVVLLYLWPVFALLFQSLFRKKRPGWKQIGLLLAAFAGVLIMNLHRDFSLHGKDLPGSLLMIASAALFSVTMLLFKTALKELDELSSLFHQNAVGALIFLPFLIGEIPAMPPVDLGIGLVYGVAVGIVSFGLFFFSLKRLPIFQYSALAYSEVIFGLIFSVTVLGEGLVINQIAGALIVVAASFYSQQVE